MLFLRSEVRYPVSRNVEKAKRTLTACCIFFYLYLVPVPCLDISPKAAKPRYCQLATAIMNKAVITRRTVLHSNAHGLLASTFYLFYNLVWGYVCCLNVLCTFNLRPVSAWFWLRISNVCFKAETISVLVQVNTANIQHLLLFLDISR